MPKSSDLSNIVKAIERSKNADLLQVNPHYFLFLLGTDTLFTSKPTKPHYENGETLSYMAQTVAKSLEEEDELKIAQDKQTFYTPLAFSTPSIDVLNGPKTVGSEVGERIAQGVFLCLLALAEGKTTIQIPAHSRGAVQAILIAHELERIKIELDKSPNKTLKQILLETSCVSYTQVAFAKLTEVKESQEVRATLSARLKTAKLNLFLIDPVPGGSFMGLPYTAWIDSRFYHKIPCNSHELIIKRDERSQCFKPIIPTNSTPLIMPGHHGTASGNIYTQQSAPVKFKIIKSGTASVQQVVTYKLIDFINKHTGIFERNKKPIDLQHPSLDPLVKHYLEGSVKDRLQMLYDLYKVVLENDPAFREFKESHYSGLYTECASSGARYVHAGNVDSIGLDSVVSDLHGCVNKEHALLALHHEMNLSLLNNDIAPDALISSLEELLIKVIADLTKNLLDDAKRKSFHNFLEFFIDTMSQKYLNNHVTVEIKTKLLANIEKVFLTLDQYKLSHPDHRININNLKDILQKGLKNTTEVHYKSLLDQSNNINEKLIYSTEPAAVEHAFKEFLNALKVNTLDYHLESIVKKFTDVKFAPPKGQQLSKKAQADKKLAEQKMLNDLKTLMSSFTTEFEKNVSNPLENVKTFFNSQLEFIRTQTSPDVAQIASNLILTVMKHPDCRLDIRFAVNPLDKANYLIELDNLHENMSNLIEGRAHVQKLVGKELLAIEIDLLVMHRDRTIKNAAQFLLSEKADLRIKPAQISEKFFKLIKGYIESLNPLESELDELKRQHRALDSVAKSYGVDKARKDEEINGLKKIVNELSSEHQQQVTAEQNLQKKNTQLHADLSALQKDNTEIATKRDEYKKQFDALQEVNKKSDSEIEQLKKNAKDLETKLSEAQQKLSNNQTANTKEIDALGQKVGALQKDIDDANKKLADTVAQSENAQKANAQELKKTNDDKQKVVKALQSPKELDCAELIQTKLIPLTRDYMTHLINEAKKINPAKKSNYAVAFPVFVGNEADKAMYEKINAKFSATKELIAVLRDIDKRPLPSERIFEFAKILKTKDVTLSSHRDKAWKQYCKNAAIAIGIICSGIIPGIIALIAYSVYSQKSSPLFFANSEGGEYAAQLQQALGNSPVR